ncbi:MAG: hypothetical protein ACRC46_13340 [Thermoguttaceae bacterium]
MVRIMASVRIITLIAIGAVSVFLMVVNTVLVFAMMTASASCVVATSL